MDSHLRDPLLASSNADAAPSDLSSHKRDDQGDHGDQQQTPPVASSPNLSQSSLAASVFNLTNTIIGAGIMAFPSVFKTLGTIPGVIVSVFVGWLTYASMALLTHSTEIVKEKDPNAAVSYASVASRICGPIGMQAVRCAIAVNNFGLVVAYLIIIGDVLAGNKEENRQGVIEELSHYSDEWWEKRTLTISVVLVIFIFPLCTLRRLDSLKFTSGISVTLAATFITATVSLGIAKAAISPVAIRLLPDFSSTTKILDIFSAIPIMLNALICHYNLHGIANELTDRTERRINAVSLISIGLCTILYTLTGTAGYYLFTKDTESDVLQNFDRDLSDQFSFSTKAIADVIKLGYLGAVTLTFPLINFELRNSIGSLIFQEYDVNTVSWNKFIGLTVGILSVVYLGAVFIPNIKIAFQFTGATAAVLIGFVMPALVAHKQALSDKLWLVWFLYVISGIVFITGIGSAVIDVI